MKKLLPALLALAACTSSTDSPSTVAAQATTEPTNTIVDAQYGYGEIRLGDSLQRVAELVNLELVPRVWPTVLYTTTPNDNLYLDTVLVTSISYEFWQNKLYQINFNSGRPGLLEAGKRRYGLGRQISPTEYVWEGQKASARYTAQRASIGTSLVIRTVYHLRISDNAAAAQVNAEMEARTPR